VSSISGECRIGTKDPAPLPETISAQDRFISARTRMSPVGAGKCGRQQSHRHHQHRKLRQFWVDHDDWSAAGRSETGNRPRQNALDPGFHGLRMVRRMRTVMLMVSAWPESGFWDVPLGRGLLAKAGGEANTGFSVGKGEQKVEMTVGDFGAPDVSQRAVGRRGSTSCIAVRRPERSTSRAPSVGEGLHPHRRTAESWGPASGRR